MVDVVTSAPAPRDPPSPGGVAEANRKALILLAAIALLFAIDLLPSPAPLERAGNLIPLTMIYTTPGFTDEKIHLFMATGLSAGETKHEADEFLDLQPMLLSQALERVESGEIQDAKTVIGLLFAAGFRAGR